MNFELFLKPLDEFFLKKSLMGDWIGRLFVVSGEERGWEDGKNQDKETEK